MRSSPTTNVWVCMLLVISVCSSAPCLHSHQPTPSSGPAGVTGSCPTGPWTLTASWQFRTSSPKTQASMFARAQICLPWTKATPSSTCQVRDPRHRIPLPINPCYPTSSGSCSRPVPSRPVPTPNPSSGLQWRMLPCFTASLIMHCKHSAPG